MGFGTDILIVLVLGLLVLGPKRLHAMLGHVARARAQFEEASRGFKSPLSAELEGADQDHKPDDSHERPGATESLARHDEWDDDRAS